VQLWTRSGQRQRRSVDLQRHAGRRIQYVTVCLCVIRRVLVHLDVCQVINILFARKMSPFLQLIRRYDMLQRIDGIDHCAISNPGIQVLLFVSIMCL
jgi:hypothetical protein